MKLDRRALRAAGTVLVALLAVFFWWFQHDTDDTTPASDRGSSAVSDASPVESDASESGDSTDATPYVARSGTDPESGLPWVAVSALPVEAEETLELIEAGGPYPYDRDDITFGNYEGILPPQPRGHYREYTVPTPGLSHRGARRIVTGGADEYYWTDDHYASFQRIDWPVDR